MMRRTTISNESRGEQLSLPFAQERCPPTPALEPFTVRITEAMRLTGLRRSKIYELIASDNIETVKVGRCTLVLVSSLRALIERGRSAPL